MAGSNSPRWASSNRRAGESQASSFWLPRWNALSDVAGISDRHFVSYTFETLPAHAYDAQIEEYSAMVARRMAAGQRAFLDRDLLEGEGRGEALQRFANAIAAAKVELVPVGEPRTAAAPRRGNGL